MKVESSTLGGTFPRPAKLHHLGSRMSSRFARDAHGRRNNKNCWLPIPDMAVLISCSQHSGSRWATFYINAGSIGRFY